MPKKHMFGPCFSCDVITFHQKQNRPSKVMKEEKILKKYKLTRIIESIGMNAKKF